MPEIQTFSTNAENETVSRKQRIHFIVNPFSGIGRKRRLKKQLEKYLDKEKYDYQISYTEYPGHAKTIARNAIHDQADMIVAVGGDGSVNEIASQLIHTDKILGILPAGSGNGFAMHLGISRRIRRAIKAINEGKVDQIDTCELNERPFVNVAGIGFPAWVAYKSSSSSFRGFLGYMWTAMRETIAYKMQHYRVIVDGSEIQKDCLAIEVANASMFGYNMKIAPKARLNDGLLEVVIIKKAPKWRYFLSLWRFRFGSVHKSSLVDTFTAREVEIIAPGKSAVHVDGEGYVAGPHLKFSIKPLSLKVWQPK